MRRGKAEQYYKEVGTTPRLQTRLQTFHYKLVYQEKVRVFSEGIDALDAAVKVVTCVAPQAFPSARFFNRRVQTDDACTMCKLPSYRVVIRIH